VVVADPMKDPTQKLLTAAVAISPDGKLALATNDADHRITVLKIEGGNVTVVRDFYAGLRPYALDIAPNGKFAIVGNLGFGVGDADTISLVDLEGPEPHAVDTATAGLSVEGVKISPDSSVVVAVLQNGSNKGASFPYKSDKGKIVLFRVEGKTLKRAAESLVGRWPQCAAFSADGRELLVGAMVDKEIEVFKWDGAALTDTGARIGVNGGPAAIRTAER
jgi:DNA-binding beta-propeller fold protein YncE